MDHDLFAQWRPFIHQMVRQGTGPSMLLALTCCTEPNTEPFDLPLEVSGTEVAGPIEARNGWEVTLSRADIAFGPLYLCSGAQAGELCDTARAEWVGSVVIDGLREEPVTAGVLEGTTGVTRSWMYDHGIASLLTAQQPVPLDAAETLGGNSIAIDGVARKDASSIAFRVRMPIQQEEETETGVPVIRKSGSDAFEQDIEGNEAFLRVRFDIRPWLSDVDFTPLFDQQEVTLSPDSQGFRAIHNAVVAGQRPTFEWGPPDNPTQE